MSESISRAEARRTPAPEALDDEDLLARLLANLAERDPAAERELCRRFAPRIWHYGLRHLGSAVLAQDLVQEVLLILVAAVRRGQVSDPSHLVPYVLTTCRNVAFAWRRTDRRRQEILDGARAEDLYPALATEDFWRDPTDGALDAGRLRGCLERLAARDRTVLEQSFFEDRPARAIAEALSLSEGNVRVLRHRALLRLRDCLAGGSERS